MAALASVTDSYNTVPDWIESNSQLFRAVPPRADRARRGIGSNARAVVLNDDDGGEEEHYAAACQAAMLINTDPGVGWIDAPSGLQPASYFRDSSNHPNILATIVYTARSRAGFVPGVMGQQLSQQQWKDYISKFNAWLSELDAFWFYITLINQDSEHVPNEAGTSDAIVDSLSRFVLTTANVEEGENGEAKVIETIMRRFELAAEYMVEKIVSATEAVAGFQHEAFGSPGPSNPTLPISFSITALSKSENNPKSSAIQYKSATMHRFTFQLNSANVIANAEALAASANLLSTKAYCDHINGPLDEWAKSLATRN